MKSLIIQKKDISPTVEFETNGHLLIEGRSIITNATEFFMPLNHFVRELCIPLAVFDINLEYFNTGTSKSLLTLLKLLDSNFNIPEVQVNWYYEKFDSESKKMAEFFEDELSRIHFTYIIQPAHVSIRNKKPFKYFY